MNKILQLFGRMRYKKKPVVIEAIQWNGDNRKEVFDFCPLSYFTYNPKTDSLDLKIKTLEGHMIATEGDFIIKGVKGEYYPCKPDIFEITYDSID